MEWDVENRITIYINVIIIIITHTNKRCNRAYSYRGRDTTTKLFHQIEIPWINLYLANSVTSAFAVV